MKSREIIFNHKSRKYGYSVSKRETYNKRFEIIFDDMSTKIGAYILAIGVIAINVWRKPQVKIEKIDYSDNVEVRNES